MSTTSEPAINTMLAQALAKRGLFGAPEIDLVRKSHVRRPDVLLLIGGAKIILEGKKEKPTARDELEEQCTRRITEGLCDVSIGIVYKFEEEGKIFFSNEDLMELLAKSKFDVKIWIPGSKTPEATVNWSEIDIDGLARLTHSAINEVASKDILDDAVTQLRESLESASEELSNSVSKASFVNTAEKLSSIIEVSSPKDDKERIRTVQMALLVLTDSIIFYNIAAPAAKLDSIEELKSKKRTWSSALRDGFEKILVVNYEPVFLLSLGIIQALPAQSESTIDLIMDVSKYIASSKALLKHDLMGRIYHKLLFEDLAKHLATYYTSVPSAWLLARVALQTNHVPWQSFDWSDPDEVDKLRIGDMACGSGTLLSAIYRGIEDKFALARSENEMDFDFQKLHKNLMEKVIYGFDVMTYAAHIATLTLALHSPDNIFRRDNIFVMPLGVDGKQLGSVNFLRRDEQALKTTSLEGIARGPVRIGVSKREIETVTLQAQSFDLLIMNPPFARTSGDNLMFGSIMDKKIRAEMQAELQKLLREIGFNGIGQAGLGAVFVLLADKFVKLKGRIAFVLPRNLLSGVSWFKIRELIAKRSDNSSWIRGGYHLEYVMLSAERGSYNFSENTDLSECMFIARKLDKDEAPKKTCVVIFHKKPKNVFDSLIVSEQLVENNKVMQSSNIMDILSNPNGWPGEVSIGDEPIGKIYSLSYETLLENVDNWGRLVAFAHVEISKIAYHLTRLGSFSVPGGIRIRIPLRTLTDLATVGPDRHQVGSSFRLVKSGGIIDTVYGKDMAMNTLEISPNGRLAARAGEDVGSILRTASHWLVPERLWLDTTSIVSLYCPKPALSNVWWSVAPKKSKKKESDSAKILSLWSNSTPGLLVFISELEVTRGGWVGMKKATLESMKVLDLDTLDASQTKKLVELYDELKSEVVPMLYEQFKQAVKGDGWRYKLDSELLKIISGKSLKDDGISSLYQLLAAESEHWKMPIKPAETTLEDFVDNSSEADVAR